MRSSIVTRWTLAVAAAAVAAVLLLYLVTDHVVRSGNEAALRRATDVEIAAAADIHATGGQAELASRIGDRLAMRAEGIDQTHYLLAGPGGERIVGDIAHWPLLSAENSEARFVELDDGTPVFARATQLAPDLRVVVAREYRTQMQLLARIRWAFLAAGALILIAALALGWRASSRLRSRVDAINQAFRAIEGGDLHRPVTGAEAGDELGELTAHANRLVARLAALVDAQRDVTDQVAHELRTPLAHLDGRLLRLIDRSVDPALTEALGEARKATRGIAQLLDSLLDIAASEARRGDRSGFQRLDLSQLVEDVAELYGESAEEFGLHLKTAIAPGITIVGDAMQLTRLLSNLIDNAFKYVGKGGTIELALQPGPRIVVRDNGPGVPEELRERIFDRFQRGAGGDRGHGLGLALVRAIAQRHGLAIACRDARPGAEFELVPEGRGE